MYVAMNRFRVRAADEAAFEAVWRERKSHLGAVPGFVEFRLLKGPSADGVTLYASHSIWADEASFRAWTRSEAFRAAHHAVGSTGGLYLEAPAFEGFTSVEGTETRGGDDPAR